MMLVEIKSRHFVGAIRLEDDVVVAAAPVLIYMRGWSRQRVRDYCRAKAWDIRVVQPQGKSDEADQARLEQAEAQGGASQPPAEESR